MLIFDRFQTVTEARRFAAAYGGTVCLTVEESDAIDPFPFELVPPIVLVPRNTPPIEATVEKRVKVFGGRFAGT